MRRLAILLALLLAAPAHADNYGSWAIDDVLTFTVTTHDSSTGAVTDADSAPDYRVYEDETATPILTGTMALLDSTNTDGFYSEQITLSAANGLEKGKSYTIWISATVSSVDGTVAHNFQIEAEVDANTVSDTVGLDDDAITGAKYDETTAFPLASADSGSTEVARTGADSDTLETLSDQIDGVSAGSGLTALASGTAQGGTASTIQLAATETFADDELNHQVVKVTSGTGAGQSRLITDYTGSTDTATVTPNWATNPDATSVYEVVDGPVFVAGYPGTLQSLDDLDTQMTQEFTDIRGDGYVKADDSLEAQSDRQQALSNVDVTVAAGSTTGTLNLTSPDVTYAGEYTQMVIIFAGDTSTAGLRNFKCTVSASTDGAPDTFSVFPTLPATPQVGDTGTLYVAGSGLAQTGDAFGNQPPNFVSLGINGSGHLARVTLVDTTTANMDMRGTDGALLASSAPPNWSSLGIEADGDLTEVNTLTGHTPQTGDSFVRIGLNGSGLSAVPYNSAWDAPINAQMDQSLADAHLDHFFAQPYDPTAKPGDPGSLWNTLLESDGGTERFTANALEQAPSGGGGGGGISVEARTQTPVAPVYTADLSRRADGTLHATIPIRIGEYNTIQPAVGLDTTDAYGGQWVGTVGTPTVIPAGQLAVAEAGPQAELAVVQLQGGHQADTTYKVEVPFTMQNGDPDVATFYVEVVSTPATP